MLARIRSAALHGLDPVPVDVEVSITNGLPAFHVVGLPDAAVRESRERVVSALRQSGFEFPLRRITANLAPAHLKKEGSAFDLPLALAVLAASGQVPAERAAGWLAVGELALDGTLRPVRGALVLAECAALVGAHTLVVPRASAAEAALAGTARVWPASSLTEVVGWLRGAGEPEPIDATAAPGVQEDSGGAAPADRTGGAGGPATRLEDVAGQLRAKRALETAAAGGHNLLFVGPPGAGKTLLARALPGLLPPLTAAESLEVTRVHSVAGLLPSRVALVARRPFRSPHASISCAGLLGGGSVPRPGEVSLAHRGVLFLDELPEFRRDALEALRAPLEEGTITVVRAAGAFRFPAAFQLVAALNPCPCGNLGHPRKGCRCGPDEIRRYRARVSGPLLDRIDLQLEVPPVRAAELAPGPARDAGPTTVAAATRVARARARQSERNLGCGDARGPAGGAPSGIGVPAVENARLSPGALERLAPLHPATRALLTHAVERLGLSARAYHRIWRVARTIADLDGAEEIATEHLSEAVTFRALDRDPAP